MKTLELVKPTEERNGILVKKTVNNINSCELRKISIGGRDNGYIASVNQSGAVVVTGISWRGKMVKSPVENLHQLVAENIEEIKKIINN